jgi:hypothetical protein
VTDAPLDSIGDRWNAFWYETAPASDLAACRILFFGAVLAHSLRLDYRELATVPHVLWRPIWPFQQFEAQIPSAEWLNALQWTWRFALLTACLGLATSLSTLVALALGFYLTGLTENLARINHTDAIVIFGLAAMALSRCSDAWSLDRKWFDRGSSHQASGEYTWPLRVMWLVFVSIYFAAAISKLAISGVVWVTSDNLANLLMFGPILGSPFGQFGQQIGRSEAVSSSLAAVSLGIEVMLPLALVSRAARLVLVPAMFAMQVSIRILLGPGFTEFLFCGVFWIPWQWVRRRASALRPAWL